MKKDYTCGKKILLVVIFAILLGIGGIAHADEPAYHLTYIDCNTMDENAEDTNYFVVGFNRDMTNATDWEMNYTDGRSDYVTHKVATTETKDKIDACSVSNGNSVVFYVKQQTGEYEITSIRCKLDERDLVFDVEKEAEQQKNIDVVFRVQPTQEELEAWETKAGELSQFMLPMASSNQNVFREEEGRLLSLAARKASEDGKIVVMLDPGHGGNTGANRTYNGVKYYEDALCLKIANACKESLMKNDNIQVFLTRTTNVNMALSERAKLAETKGAVMLVSLHLNATDAALVKDTVSSTGAEVIYQNGNYNSTVAAWSKSLAGNIEDELVALGLKRRGTYYKNASSLKYPDGTVADYFAINREAKLLGLPGIIVEHCFINNQNDFNLYLASDKKLARLGEADAEGILKFINASANGGEKPASPTGIVPSAMSKMRVKISFRNDGEDQSTVYELYRADSADGTYAKIANSDGEKSYFIDSTGKAGKTYFYKIRAVKAGKSGYLYSEFSKVVSYTFLKTPTYVSGTIGEDGSFTIKWNQVTGATGYQVARSDSPTGTFQEVGKVTDKNFTDRSAGGKTYYYKVRAYHVLEDRTAYSYYASVRMPGTRIKSADRVSSSSLLLQWEEKSDMTGYRIYRKNQTGSSYKLLAEVPAGTTKYLDETVDEETAYKYNIRVYRKLSTGKIIESLGTIASIPTSLTTPTVTKAQPEADGTVTIEWSASKNADGYYIYRLEQASETIGDKQKLGSVSGNTLQYVDKEAHSGHAYLYAVQAYRVEEKGITTSFADQMALSGTVIEAVLSYSGTSIRVGWQKLDNVDGYKVYRSTTKASGYKLVKSVGKDTTSLVDTGLKTGTTYYYRVRPYRKEKVKNSVGKEKELSFLAKNYRSSQGAIVAAPQISRITANSEKALQITWSKTNGAAGYQVYRCDKKTGTYTRVGKVTGEQKLQYEDTEIVLSKTYYYKVRAYFEKNGVYGYTPFSQVVSSGFKVSSILPVSSKSIKLSWEEAAGFDQIRVYRKKSSESSYKLIATVAADKGSYTDTGLSEGTKYDYKLVGCKVENGNTITGSSVIVSATTLSKPKLISARVGSTGAVYIKWDKTSDVSGYEVFRSETGKTGSFQKIATVSGETKVSYKDETAKEKKIYYYKLRAYVTEDNKTYHSSYSSVQISGVAKCKVQAYNSTKNVIRWEDVAGAVSYELWVKRPQQTVYSSLGIFKAGDTTYTDANLTAGESYSYRVTVSDGKYTSYPGYATSVKLIGKVTNLSVKATYKSNGLTLTWEKVSDAEKYMIYRKDAGEDTYTKITTVTGADMLTYTDNTIQANQDYTYRVRATKTVSGVVQYGSYSNTIEGRLVLTEVMGVSKATKAQMIAYYKKSGKKFPVIYADAAYGGVQTIEEFVQIMIEEASAEGVRADLLAAQVFKETGYLQFGGDVKASQCNFGGIGAVGGGAKGASFADVRTGLRAQVQHLKAYGDANAALVYQCVDPRYQYVTKGCAKYIEWLGIKENPNGMGWATAVNYGVSLVTMMNAMKGM